MIRRVDTRSSMLRRINVIGSPEYNLAGLQSRVSAIEAKLANAEMELDKLDNFDQLIEYAKRSYIKLVQEFDNNIWKYQAKAFPKGYQTFTHNFVLKHPFEPFEYSTITQAIIVPPQALTITIKTNQGFTTPYNNFINPENHSYDFEIMDEHFLKEGATITNQIINLTFNKRRIFYNYRAICDYDWRQIPIVTMGYHSSKNQIRIYLLDMLTAEKKIVMTKKFGANPNYHCGTLTDTTSDWPLHTINNNILFLDQAHYINDFDTFLNFTLATALSNYFDIINVTIGNAISHIPDLLGSSGHYLSAIYYLEETLLETQSKLFALAQNSVSYVSASIQNVDFKDFNIQYSATQDHCRFNVTTDNIMSVSVDTFETKLAHYAPNIETVNDPHFTTKYTPDIYWHSPVAELIFDFYFPNVTHITKFNDFVISRYFKIEV